MLTGNKLFYAIYIVKSCILIYQYNIAIQIEVLCSHITGTCTNFNSVTLLFFSEMVPRMLIEPKGFVFSNISLL